MKISRSITRRARLIASAAGLAALAALALPTAGAAATEPTPAYGPAALAEAGDAVLDADVAGTAWYVDEAAGKLVVTADSRVSQADIAKIRKAAGTNAGAVEINRAPGRFRPLLQGGDGIHGYTYRCSAGFNVVSGSTYLLVTAGHCGRANTYWWAGPNQSGYIGQTIDFSFPDNDFALVRYDTSISHPGTAGGVDITGAADAYRGMPVTRSGSTSGTHSGTVTATDVAVNYGSNGIVHGMIQTNICAEPGDSGGPLRSGSNAVGITSGGGGDCTHGGLTFYQPITEVLDHYGVSVY